MNHLQDQEELWDEMLDGEVSVYTPCPPEIHNVISDNLYRILSGCFHDSGIFCKQKTGVILTADDRAIPDVLVTNKKGSIRRDGIHGAPDLVVEVVSPSSIKTDKGYKKELYERCGVREYWIVDPRAKSIEVYLLRDRRFHLDDCYVLYTQKERKEISDEEQEYLVDSFCPSVFPGKEILLKDVFHKAV